MASITKDKNGNVTIQFVGGDKKRRSIRLGKINAKAANEVKLKVEHLNALLVAKLPMDAETARWVAGIGDELAAKLAAVGLIPPRVSAKLGEYLDGYLEQRRKDSKPNSVLNIDRVAQDLIALFGREADMRDITAGDAERFKAEYVGRKLAAATTHRRLKFAKMLFAHAVKRKLIPENPFVEVKLANVVPAERRKYVSAEDTEKLLAVANPTWRTLIALSRYAGLRCPTEVLSLRWEHIDFAAGRMTVTAPKTEHIPGKGYRVVPIFPRLRPYLEDAYELAADGEQFVIGGEWGDRYRQAAGGRWKSANLRTVLLKLIRRAGLTTWPKPFHNLRASCETDLVRDHPLHVVTAWLGNTPSVATAHYLQVLDLDFQKALGGGAESGAVVVQKAVQSGADANGQESQELAEVFGNQGLARPSGVLRLLLSDSVSIQEYTQKDSNLQPSVP